MGIVYRCLSLLALCTLLCACPAEPPAADEPSPEPEDEPYFTLSCLRATPGDGGLRWYCSGDPETDLITGKIVLYYNATGDGALIFCAKDTILNSGNEFADTTVSNLDGGCVTLPESLGEFSWYWDGDTTLDVNWTKTEKLVFYIPHGPEYRLLVGEAYYHSEQN